MEKEIKNRIVVYLDLLTERELRIVLAMIQGLLRGR